MGRIQDLLSIIRSKPDHLVVRALDELLPRWITVVERLPDDREQCLVAHEDSIGIAWWHSGPQKFIHDDIDNAWTPTHWMPLPEPPAS